MLLVVPMEAANGGDDDAKIACWDGSLDLDGGVDELEVDPCVCGWS